MRRADGQDNYKSSYVNMAQGAVDCIFPPILDECVLEFEFFQIENWREGVNFENKYDFAGAPATSRS